MGLLSRLLGEGGERESRHLGPTVQEFTQLEPEMQPLSAEGIRAKTDESRARISEALDGVAEEPRKAAAQEVLDDLLPEAFALVREASRRTIGQRHFDVQLMGGAILPKGKIAEMKTGEGRRLGAPL